jgi:hypothetical protein
VHSFTDLLPYIGQFVLYAIVAMAMFTLEQVLASRRDRKK